MATEVKTVAQLEADALAQVPGGDFGSDSYREGLEVLLRSVRDEARPTEAGVHTINAIAERALINRAQINQCYAEHPEIEDEVITNPVFSIGMVRTGTTALSYLLECDPDNRSLIHWQAMRPCPPPEAATLLTDPRIAITEQEMGTIGLSIEQKALIELLPDGPAEDLHLLVMDFKSGHFEGMFQVPSYHDWLFSTDLRSGYQWMKRVLKLLQWRVPTKRWMLKFPSHTIALPAISDTFPDAKFIVTHRDPVKSITSVCSLIENGAGQLSQLDLHKLGAHWTNIIETQLRRMIDYRAEHDKGQFIDIQNDELIRAPMPTLERLYDFMGIEMTPAAREGLEGRTKSSPKGVHGAHTYDPATYGLNVDEIAERFRFYTDKFNIRLER